MNAVTACVPPKMAVQVDDFILTLPMLPFAPGPGRIDTIVWQRACHTMNPSLEVLHGVPSYLPTSPTLIDNGSVTQVPLAHVSVAAGQAAIMDCHITPVVDDRVPAILDELLGVRP